MGAMWLMLNEMGNEIDRKIAATTEEFYAVKRKLNKLDVERERLVKLREIERELSKKGLV